MKLLLIGNGYLGQAVARVFRENGWHVAAVSLSGGEGSRAADVGDRISVEGLREETPDFMIHCAASGRGGAEAYQRVYVEGCRHLVAVFPGVPLLFTSSTSVYAQTDGSDVTEDSAADPERETGRLLLEAERVVLAAEGIVARLSGIYGPGRSVILKKFLSGDAIIEEDGRRFLNQIHRDDAARAIFKLAVTTGTRGHIFNVSDNQPLPQIECYRQLAAIFGKSLPPSGPRDPDRKRGWTHKRVLNSRLVAIGWTPEFPSFTEAVEAIAPTL